MSKRVQITLEVDYESEERFRTSFYFYTFLVPAIRARDCLSFLIEEVNV